MGKSDNSGRARGVGLGLLLAAGLATGCENMMHNLQPHRLQRLNRTSDGMSSDAYNWSVPDPIPAIDAKKLGNTKTIDKPADSAAESNR